jgi:hypothetical protein
VNVEESVAALILRGPRIEINKLTEKIQREGKVRLVFLKVGPHTTYYYVKELRKEDRENVEFNADY